MNANNGDTTSKVSRIALVLKADLQRNPPPSHKPVPSIRQIAQTYGTSLNTILKVLNLLCSQGILEKSGAKRCRYFYRQSPQNNTTLEYSTRRDTVQKKLKNDILSGNFPGHSPLPSLKQLAVKYRCGIKLIKSELANLATNGILVQAGRSYHIHTQNLAKKNPTVYIVTKAQSYLHHDEVLWKFVAGVEQEANRLGWSIGHLLNHDIKKNLPAAAFLCLNYNERLLSRLSKMFPKVPIVVIDSGDALEENFKTKNFGGRALRIYNDQELIGRKVAGHLAGLGHRHIAIIGSIPSRYGWPKKRMNGIFEVFPQDLHQKSDFSSIPFNNEKALYKQPTNAQHVRRHSHNLRKALRESRLIPWKMQYYLVNPTYSLNEVLQKSVTLEPLFEKALENKKITAWICLNDETAAIANHFLNRKGIQAGKDVSLVAIDNSRLAFSMGITSFDLDYTSIGHLALKWLESPHILGPSQIIEYSIPGYLVIRGSSGIP